MPWNQPGGDNKDPWSGGGNNNRQGPPDLEEWLKKLTAKFGGGNNGGNSDNNGSGMGRAGSAGILGLLLLGFIIWAASGFFIVGEGERGLVMRFGQYSSVSEPGPHWHIPAPFETVEMVDIDQVRSFQHRATMLTQDENIVDIELAAQYRIKDPVSYTYRVRSPDLTLQQAVESALREAVGKQKMDYVLNEGRPQIAATTRELSQAMLDSYDAGMEITTINLQQSQPPEQVQDAFNDAIKAREDNVRFVNEAEAYANGIVPLARGEAARLTEEAAAYRDEIIARSEGEAARFESLLTQYEKAPEVTRKRLYLETIESVLGNTSKVMVDSTQGGNSMMYLPLDKMLSNTGTAGSNATGNFQGSGNTSMSYGNNGSSNSTYGSSTSRPTRSTTRESR